MGRTYKSSVGALPVGVRSVGSSKSVPSSQHGKVFFSCSLSGIADAWARWGSRGGVMTGRCGGLLGTCVEKGRVGKGASEYTATAKGG